ncbi:Zn-dependent protease [Thiorhodovibrio winogradskyi]|uniref:Zn-dependent protease n=1 Tax=Thiorhodovibrio winogradskyi TaxID=77007 RepID=A0ABZ0SFW7_9GAMM|nr:hypothetical protein [Thiorhodovibrio winogradskyi]
MAGTFSESWYRVAHLCLALRPGVTCRKQYNRGHAGYLLQDPHNKNFYRLTSPLYQFVARLRLDKTVEQVWVETLEQNPDTGPGQQDVIALLVDLQRENLLYFPLAADSKALFERGSERSRRESQQKWMNFLFIRFPLWNPAPWLLRWQPLWRLLVGRVVGVIWLLTLAVAILAGIQHASELGDQTRHVLAADNLLLLYLGIALLKVAHELGHAAISTRFGGEVSSVGIMLLLFIPLPYVDATSSWELRDKWQRILVSAGGMIVELFFGAVACLIWVNAAPGVVNSLAYNMMFAATVSTVLFNGNPLLRYDGYYILADLLEIPNLYEKSRDLIYRLCERYLFGLRHQALPGADLAERLWMLGYGLASVAYRLLLLIGILLFIGDQYATLGLILALFMGVSWLLRPVVKFGRYLLTSPSLREVRGRALGVALVLVGLPVLFALLYPLPVSVVVPGVVQSLQRQEVFTETGGRLLAFERQPGARVEVGDTLLRLDNPLLEVELEQLRLQLRQLEVLEQQALREGGGDRQPLARRREALEQLLADVRARQQGLHLVAQQSGIWIAPDSGRHLGQWVGPGQFFGLIAASAPYRFSAVVSQEQASDLFTFGYTRLNLRLRGQGGVDLAVPQAQMLPHAHEELPSAALGWPAGGDIATDPEDQQGVRSREPFYLLKAQLPQTDEVLLLEGQTGRLRILLPPQPLLLQAWRRLRQFLLQRYEL